MHYLSMHIQFGSPFKRLGSSHGPLLSAWARAWLRRLWRLRRLLLAAAALPGLVRRPLEATTSGRSAGGAGRRCPGVQPRRRRAPALSQVAARDEWEDGAGATGDLELSRMEW